MSYSLEDVALAAARLAILNGSETSEAWKAICALYKLDPTAVALEGVRLSFRAGLRTQAYVDRWMVADKLWRKFLKDWEGVSFDPADLQAEP